MVKEISHTIEVLKRGGTILYPTDTIWGIGCDATNPDAVKQVFRIKQREESKKLIILLDAVEKLSLYVADVPTLASALLSKMDIPVSIIYPNAKALAKNLISSDGSICIRITNDPFCFRLIREFNFPIVSTSANIASKTAPQNFSEIDETIKDEVDYVVNWRCHEKDRGQHSSIYSLLGGKIKRIR